MQQIDSVANLFWLFFAFSGITLLGGLELFKPLKRDFFHSSGLLLFQAN
jgi:hypothetical protein|tara:strand:- start:1091 stop:1237 length:147 start_codon:yes stop_codon:yes gene_type:complete